MWSEREKEVCREGERQRKREAARGQEEELFALTVAVAESTTGPTRYQAVGIRVEALVRKNRHVKDASNENGGARD